MSDCLVERRADQREAPDYNHLPLISAGNSELQISSSQLPASARRGAEFSSVSRVSDRERLLQIRRAETKSQHHDQIWTKLAHGGPYRKCDTSRNLVPELPLGYARPEKTGPTTNFVGNHMTQGAIDLVQMDLEEGDPEGELRRLKDYCRKFRPPRLLLPKLQDTAMSTSDEVAGLELPPSSELGIVKQNPLLHADPAVLAAVQNDPRSLRRALISQRLHKEPGDGILFQTPKLLRAGLRDCEPATSQNSSLLSRDQGFDSMDARTKGIQAQAAGDFAEAANQYTFALTARVSGQSACSQGGLSLTASLNCHSQHCDILTARARCYLELGELRKAFKDSTQAINLARNSECTNAAHLLSKAYSLRSQINAQLEDSKASLDDAREARHWVSDQTSVQK